MPSMPPSTLRVNIPTRNVITMKAKTIPPISKKIGLYVTKDWLVELAIQLTMPAAPISISGSYFIENESNGDHEKEGEQYADNGYPSNRTHPSRNNRVNHTVFLMNAYRLNITYPTKKLASHAMSGKKIRSESVIYHYEFQRPLHYILNIYAWFARGQARKEAFATAESISNRIKRAISTLRQRYTLAESLYQSWLRFEARYLLIAPSSKKQFAKWYSQEDRSGK